MFGYLVLYNFVCLVCPPNFIVCSSNIYNNYRYSIIIFVYISSLIICVIDMILMDMVYLYLLNTSSHFVCSSNRYIDYR